MNATTIQTAAGSARHAQDRRSPNHPLRRVQDYRPDGTRTRRWSRAERVLRLSFRRRPLLTLASTVIVLLLPVTLVYAGTAVTSGSNQPKGKKAGVTEMQWTWSDGGSAESRTFLSSEYSVQSLPKLKVHVAPGTPGVLYLEFKQEGEWNAEWATKPDSSGNATLPIDPLCADDSWCDGTYEYRLKMPGLVSNVTIEYWDR